jgi:hypothetical protein
METCGYEFYFVLESYSVTREIIKMQYRRDVGFHFLPGFLSVFALSAIFSPLTGYTEISSVGPRARCWESCRPAVGRSNSCAVFFLKISSVYLWWLMMIKSVELD